MQERFDLFSFVHKGIRRAMQDVLGRLGQMDVDDPADVQATLEALEDLLRGLEQHIRAETLIQRALTSQAPALAEQLQREHDDHARGFASLRADASALALASQTSHASESVASRNRRARHLYLSLSRLVADNLLHMANEETEINPVLWRHFGDAELHAIWGQMMARESPDELIRGVRWIMPAVTDAERHRLVLGSRTTMDPAVFEQLLPLVAAVLPPAAFEKLQAALR